MTVYKFTVFLPLVLTSSASTKVWLCESPPSIFFLPPPRCMTPHRGFVLLRLQRANLLRGKRNRGPQPHTKNRVASKVIVLIIFNPLSDRIQFHTLKFSLAYRIFCPFYHGYFSIPADCMPLCAPPLYSTRLTVHYHLLLSSYCESSPIFSLLCTLLLVNPGTYCLSVLYLLPKKRKLF